MPAGIHHVRLSALRDLATNSNGAASDSLIGDALQHCLAASRGKVAIVGVSSPPEVSYQAQVGTTEAKARAILEALVPQCRWSLSERRSLRLFDLEQLDSFSDAESLSGFRAALISPIRRTDNVLGVLILLFSRPNKLDDALVDFTEAFCSILPLACPFEQTTGVNKVVPAEIGRAHSTGIVLLGASVGHQLEGPVSALSLQLEEQRRILRELRIVADDSDTAVGGALAELAELTDEVGAAIMRIKETALQLTQLGDRQRGSQAVDIADLAREALAILRPGLEQKGVVVDSTLAPCGLVLIHRDAVLQVALDLIAVAAELGENATSAPRVGVHTLVESERVVFCVDDVGPVLADSAFRDISERPFSAAIPDKRRRLVLRLAGDVAAAHGGHLEVLNRAGGGSSYRILLPTIASLQSESSGNFPLANSGFQSTEPNFHHVLIVDDDPVFSRSARRALQPHKVTEASTASEAEYHLLQDPYEPSVILCDLMLPGADGTKLHSRIQQARPDLAKRFLFVTGATLSKDAADYIRSSGCHAFQKPFDFARLKKQLSQCTAEEVVEDLVAALQLQLLRPMHT